MSIAFRPKSDQTDWEIITPTEGTQSVAARLAGPRAVLTGSQDLTAGTPVNVNIVSATKIKRIPRSRFWISANGGDVGPNTATRIQIKLFNTDAFLHAELDTNFVEGMIEDFGEFQFDSQDIAVSDLDNGDGSVEIDDTTLFGIDDLVRIHDGTNFEWQRLDAITSGTVASLYDTILKAGASAWSIDDDVSRVFEMRDVSIRDEDDTDELHVRFLPRSGDDDCRIHWAIEFES